MTTPNGFAGHLFFEELLRKFFAYQWKMIHETTNAPTNAFINDLFSRYGDAVRLQIKKWIVETPNLQIVINYPRQDQALPFIAIVNASEQEAPQPYLGDYGGAMYEGERSVQASSELTLPPNVYGQKTPLPDNRPRALKARRLLSIPETRTTQMFIGTEDVNLTMYLYIIVKALLLLNKMDFDQHVGARNLKVSGSDLQHKPEFLPQFAYFKMLTLNYEMNFDVPLQAQTTIGGVNLSLSTYLQSQE